MHPRQALTKEIWQAFVTQPSVEARLPDMDPHLQQVWARCRRQQRHDHWSVPHRAKGVTFDSILKSKASFLNVAVPAIEDIYEYLENDSCAFLVCDETGCTLYGCATPPEMKDKLHALVFRKGGCTGGRVLSAITRFPVPCIWPKRPKPQAMNILNRRYTTLLSMLPLFSMVTARRKAVLLGATR